MSRVEIPITALTANAVPAHPSWTAMTPASGAYIDAGGDTQNLLIALSITASGSSADAVSFKAGDNPPAFRCGLGALDLATSGSCADARYLAILESARFVSSGSATAGQVLVDFDTDTVTAASAVAFRLPQGY